jgi:GNAT superfamily N-acetyltransferase
MLRQKFVIEKTSPKDPLFDKRLEEIAGIFSRTFPENFIPEAIKEEIQKYPSFGVYYARETKSGLVVGANVWHEYPNMLEYGINSENQNQPWYWLHAVDKSFRRNKIGSRLMKAALNDFRVQGYHETNLITFIGFREMTRYCINTGWKRVKLFDKGEISWGPYNRALILRYDLRNNGNGHMKIEELVLQIGEAKKAEQNRLAEIEKSDAARVLASDIY